MFVGDLRSIVLVSLNNCKPVLRSSFPFSPFLGVGVSRRGLPLATCIDTRTVGGAAGLMTMGL